MQLNEICSEIAEITNKQNGVTDRCASVILRNEKRDVVVTSGSEQTSMFSSICVCGDPEAVYMARLFHGNLIYGMIPGRSMQIRFI